MKCGCLSASNSMACLFIPVFSGNFVASSETFIVHMVIQKQKEMPICLKKQAQIETKVQVGALLFNKPKIWHMRLIFYFF